MTYDLRRLRLNGLIHRLPGTHRYTVTTYGLRVALFYSRLALRILRPAWATLADPTDDLPDPLRRAFRQLDAALLAVCKAAHLTAAA
jgi:hypothetical protein